MEQQFNFKRQEKDFAKLLTYAVMYQRMADWDANDIENVRKYCVNRVKTLGYPDGWQQIGSYEELKQWFFEVRGNQTK